MSIFICGKCDNYADADDGCEEIDDKLICIDCVNDEEDE